MAVNKTINKRTNTHGAMRNCIEYVLRQDKTSELLTYITGPYCHNEINYDLVYRTFLEEKKMWNKDTGRMYAHNIISWHKDEQITPEQAFEFGKEFAEKWFRGFQTLVAVHKDKDHIHCHLVTNSVSYEDGKKLHTTKKDLEQMKQFTNQMCRERGLTVAEKGKHFDGSQIEKGEIIAWSKDKYNLFRQQVKDSFVADCAMAVLKALENCISKEKFIEKMKQLGWSVNWTEKRKHITFQNQDGKKVRDSNLSKTFHLDISKEGLENEFNGNYERIQAEAERTNGSDDVFAGYYRQVEAACEGAGRNAGESDGREGRVAGEKSEDERVYSGISGKDAQVENGKTKVVLRESRNARRNANVERRNSADDSRTVRNAETQSVFTAEQRRLEEQKRADVEIQRARRKAKSEVEDMKERQFFWDWGYLCVIFFSLIQNGAFQRDVLQLIMLPVNWCREYVTWFEQLDYMGYSTGEVAFERIFSSAVIMAGIIGGIFLVWGGIKQYRKMWDDIYKMVLIASISFIAVLGNMIREYLPVNMLFIIILINMGTIFVRLYLKEKLMN